jgi:hypothetical protein
MMADALFAFEVWAVSSVAAAASEESATAINNHQLKIKRLASQLKRPSAPLSEPPVSRDSALAIHLDFRLS